MQEVLCVLRKSVRELDIKGHKDVPSTSGLLRKGQSIASNPLGCCWFYHLGGEVDGNLLPCECRDVHHDAAQRLSQRDLAGVP